MPGPAAPSAVIWSCAALWGVLIAAAVLALGRARSPAARVRALTGPGRTARGGRARPAGAARRLRSVLRSGPVGSVVGGLLRRRDARRSRAARERALPAAVDLLAVAVGAGCSPYEAIVSVTPWMPGAVAPTFEEVTARIRRGDALSGALTEVLGRDPVLCPVARALDVNDRLGAPVGPALARLAATVRSDVRRRGEARARTVPVRLLFPLVFLVLPAFGLLTVVPALLTSFRAL